MTKPGLPTIPPKESIVSRSISRSIALAALALTFVDFARADDIATYEITLKDHRFTPAEIHVPTGKPFIVLVTNANDGPDEFEMLLPAVERAIAPGEQGKVRIRPLGLGRFPFFGESDPDDEQGAFISE
jgi:Cupredoxin-like domain